MGNQENHRGVAFFFLTSGIPRSRDRLSSTELSCMFGAPYTYVAVNKAHWLMCHMHVWRKSRSLYLCVYVSHQSRCVLREPLHVCRKISCFVMCTPVLMVSILVKIRGPTVCIRLCAACVLCTCIKV